MRRRHSTGLASFALLLGSILLAFVACEAAYRLYRHAALGGELVAALVAGSTEAGSSRYDEAAGYRYVPNRTWSDPARLVSWRTDAHGLIANDLDPSPYPVAKPEGEYRIAVLGDSFTASNASRVRWSDLLQAALNASEAWRRHVGGRSTRVLNFGMDGTGIVQWPAVLEHIARPFGPDLVIASFITDDITRKFVRRGGDPSRLREAAEARAQAILAGLEWTRPGHSELLAETVAAPLGLDRLAWLRPRYTLSAALANEPTIRYASQSEAIAASIAAILELKRQHPKVLLMQIPLFREILVPEDNHLRWPRSSPLHKLDSRFRFEAGRAGLRIVNLAASNRITGDDVARMYKLPADAHFSDDGVRRYADWLARYLIDQVEFWRADDAAR